MASVLDRVSAPPDETTPYADGPDQVYDVRRPQGPERAVTVVVLHGGFWRPATGRTHAASEAIAFAEAGFHVVVPEYRRASRGGWPDLRADLETVAAAVAGRGDLPDDVVLVGHSAGGHLAAWWAVQETPAHVVGAVSLGGCVALHLVHERGLGQGAAEALMGSTPQQDPQEWALADPARRGTPLAPVVAIHGSQDVNVPPEISRSYVAAVPQAKLHIIEGADHFDLIDPLAVPFAVVRDTVIELAS